MSYTRGQLIGNGANGVLGSILARLERLERQRQGADEALVPNSYTLDPNGNVNVTGINLPAATASNPPNKNKIRWIRQSDGAVVAVLTDVNITTGPTPTNQFTQQSNAPDANQSATLSLSSVGGSGDSATLSVEARRTGDPASSTVIDFAISTLNGGVPLRLMDATAASQFLQLLGGAQAVNIIGAYVDGRAASFGFLGTHWGCSVSRTGVGAYTVTPSTAFANRPVVIPWSTSVVAAQPTTITTSSIVAGSFQLSIEITATSAAVDDLFAFVAFG